jgi:hypothetical protein
MNGDASVGKNVAENYAKNYAESAAENAAGSPTVESAEWEVTRKRKWSRPTVAIMDLKRTLLFGGSNTDGISPTTGP